MKKGSVIQWFIRLIKRGMDEYEENEQEKTEAVQCHKEKYKRLKQGEKKMDYKEALKLAKEGREEGFRFLYDMTYKSKYYLALQYMKNEEAAQDVLQEAYMKAFSKLDTLEQAEAFPGWFGTIVGNTAKNMLQKKNPMSFSDVATDDEMEDFLYEIEDESAESQPELSYTRQETQELVHEMIDALSEEQRVCILMFEIEGIPIKEIAASLNCSENTVKSRLNYGRKNLKIRAEELQKKGYKLYSVAPVAFLIYLLRADERNLASQGVFAMAKEQMAEQIFQSQAANGASAGAQAATGNSSAAATGTGAKAAGNGAQAAAANGANTAAKGTAAAVKSGILHTTAGKIAAVAAAILIVDGAAVYGVSEMVSENKKTETTIEQEETKTEDETPSEETPSKETQAEPETEEQVPEIKELKMEDYPSLIAGNLTKEEVEFVLAYGPAEIPEQGIFQNGVQQQSDLLLLNYLCIAPQEDKDAVNAVEFYRHDDTYGQCYSVQDVNRLLASFTSFQYTEDTDTDPGSGETYIVNVENNELIFWSASMNCKINADITSTEYTDAEMRLYYTHDYYSYDRQEHTITDKVAVLKPVEDGKYRIVKITGAEAIQKLVPQETEAQEVESQETETQGTETSAVSQDSTESIKNIYEGVLASVKNKEPGYEFSNDVELTGDVKYFVHDLNGDGIQELVVGAACWVDVFEGANCHVYSCQKEGEAYSLQTLSKNMIVIGLAVAQDGNGLFCEEISRGLGDDWIYRLTMENGTLVKASQPEYKIKVGDDRTEIDKVMADPKWTDISDLNGLNSIK